MLASNANRTHYGADSWVLYGQVGVCMGKSAARKSQLLEVKHSKGLAMESVQKESVRKRALPSVCSTECADSDKTDFCPWRKPRSFQAIAVWTCTANKPLP